MEGLVRVDASSAPAPVARAAWLQELQVALKSTHKKAQRKAANAVLFTWFVRESLTREETLDRFDRWLEAEEYSSEAVERMRCEAVKNLDRMELDLASGKIAPEKARSLALSRAAKEAKLTLGADWRDEAQKYLRPEDAIALLGLEEVWLRPLCARLLGLMRFALRASPSVIQGVLSMHSKTAEVVCGKRAPTRVRFREVTDLTTGEVTLEQRSPYLETTRELVRLGILEPHEQHIATVRARTFKFRLPAPIGQVAP